MEKQKNSSLTILQTLTVECENTNTINPNSIQEMRETISQLSQKIEEINEFLQKTLYVNIENSQKDSAEISVDIEFLNNAIDQAIK